MKTPTKIVTVADLAQRAKMTPRLARAKLRNAIAEKRGVPKTVEESRWAWPQRDAPKVLTILRQ